MKKKIIHLSDLKNLIDTLKKKGKKIVQCHGVFDLIHIGHLKHFKSAKKFGDILIVSVTPDKFVQKGFNRPYFNSSQRLESLSSIEDIDYVILNSTKNAVDIIKKIKPNFYCKGPDYKNFKDDITNEIKNELNAVKKFGGKLVFSEDPMYSSSTILNNETNLFSSNQKLFINKIRSQINVADLNKKIEKLKKLKVLILGEAIIDKYVFCEALGKSGKEPHLVLRDLNEQTYSGGVIAVAKNLADFCKKITVISALGKKKEYENYIKKNLSKNINTKFLYRSNTPTIVKTRYIEYISNYKLLGVYTLNDEALSEKEEIQFQKMINKEISKHDVVIVSDYGHGLISKKTARLLCKQSKFLALNAQSNSSNVGYHSIQKYKNVDCVVMNETELRHELRDKNESTLVLAKKLSSIINIDNIIITKGSSGAIMYNSRNKKYYSCPAFAMKVVDKVGAGDTMLSIISIFLKLKFSNITSIFISSLAAALNVEEMSNKISISKSKLLKYFFHINK